tara:strand:+ start:1340 stop:1609 length:270 start_codon:yes stop_codon:yes gene_type:complete
MWTWLKSWCECDRRIEFDDQTIEVLRAIYDETIPLTDEEDSEDEDYEPTSDTDDDEVSSSDSEPDDDPDSDAEEEIIIKRDSEGHYYLY